MTAKLFQIWVEGHKDPNPEYSGTACLMGEYVAEDLLSACHRLARASNVFGKYFRITDDGAPLWLGCRIFDNEVDARKNAG